MIRSGNFAVTHQMTQPILYDISDLSSSPSLIITKDKKADYRIPTLLEMRDAWINACRGRTFENHDCVITTMRTTKAVGKGGVQVSIKNTKYALNVITYILFYRTYDDRLHVSHRCGKAQCVNPEHLVLESPPENESRKGCPHRNRSWTSCIHNPKCIGFHRLVD